VEVVGGQTYYRTYGNSGGSPMGEANPATVSGLRLDKYLVTVGRFRQFVTAWNGGAGWTPAAGSGKHTHLNTGKGLANSATSGTYELGWNASDNASIAPTNANLACYTQDTTWTTTAGSQENLPINCVNWYEAQAFCIWDGGFLPSETEWEYAAAAGAEQREYPWGETAPGTACPGTGCQYAIYYCYYPSGAGSCSGVSNIAPVGTATLGAGMWGQLDLSGEMQEWMTDWNFTYATPCTDCAYLNSTSAKVLRGGSFDGNLSLPPDRHIDTPNSRSTEYGFRCARTP
jgi:formylglycine-generating enzyme required for sulfatase activity